MNNNSDSSRKSRIRTIRSSLLFLIPNILVALFSLTVGLLFLLGFCECPPRIFVLSTVLLLLIFLLSIGSLVSFYVEFRESGNFLSDLLKGYGLIGADERYTISDILSKEGRREILSSADEYMGRINQLQFLRNQAEYNAHQSQINPHFLYNTLDTIRGKAMEYDQDVVADMIECLSRIFRYSISNKSDMFALQDELTNVKDYAHIQQVRFANRVSFRYDVDESDWRLLYFHVPKLILQPLVENAINHGLEGMVSGGEVCLSAYRTEQHVILRVTDNGQGIPVDQVKAMHSAFREETAPARSAGSGIALLNINQRIKHIFGSEYGISLSSVEGHGTTVEIVMPYKGEQEA